MSTKLMLDCPTSEPPHFVACKYFFFENSDVCSSVGKRVLYGRLVVYPENGLIDDLLSGDKFHWGL
jgi:hypothetical protein